MQPCRATNYRVFQSSNAMLNTFRYAHGAIFTRAHECNEDEPGGKSWPLVDLFTGGLVVPLGDSSDGKCIEADSANAFFVSGMWPFAKGPMFRNDCDFPCSSG
mmetsp:Transcript_7011/g.20354  ORF Transcript_7011/g.20354 Transcript_7011/m.20354 type:complete len:103 (+) Transcript_7011:977-1285(+)